MKLSKIKERFWMQIFIIYTRYFLGGAFVFASLIKLKGMRFTTESGEHYPIDNAWHFFETMYQSGLYWKFIGFGQLLAGCLLMTQKYARLGAIINLPIILNVFVITLSYNFNYTPVVTGVMLLANVVLIIWEWDILKVVVNRKPQVQNITTIETDKLWQVIGIVLFLFTFIYRLIIDKYNILFWMTIFSVICFTGVFVSLFRPQKEDDNQKNN